MLKSKQKTMPKKKQGRPPKANRADLRDTPFSVKMTGFEYKEFSYAVNQLGIAPSVMVRVLCAQITLALQAGNDSDARRKLSAMFPYGRGYKEIIRAARPVGHLEWADPDGKKFSHYLTPEQEAIVADDRFHGLPSKIVYDNFDNLPIAEQQKQLDFQARFEKHLEDKSKKQADKA